MAVRSAIPSSAVNTSSTQATPLPPAPVYVQLFFVMAAWGVNLVAVKYLLGQMDVYVVAAVRIVVAFTTVTSFMLLRFGQVPRLTRAQLAWVLSAGLLVVYGHQIALVAGLRMTSAANATLIMATSPLFSVVLGALCYREKLTPARIGAAVLAWVGWGWWWPAAAAGWRRRAWAIYWPCWPWWSLSLAAWSSSASRALDPLTILWYTYLAGAVALSTHAALSPATYRAASWTTDPWAWTVVFFSAVIASGACNLLWNRGIARLGMSRAAMFVNWLPIFGLLAAAVFLDERITLVHLAGLVCVLLGTWLGLRPARPAAA